MRVRARLRYDDGPSFIRLPLHIIQKLYVEAEATSSQESYSNVQMLTSSDPKDFSLTEINSNENVDFQSKRFALSLWMEFIPLELTFLEDRTKDKNNKRRKVFGSFNGGILENDVSDVIEVPASLFVDTSSASPLHALKDLNETLRPAYWVDVNIRYFPNIVDAKSGIQLHPMSVSDWEMLDVHSESLENGMLLSQVSVVFPSQILMLRLDSRKDGVVIVQVQEFPEDQREQECLRLMQNTEISVKPVPRETDNISYELSFPLRLTPTNEDISTEMIDVANDAYLCMEAFWNKEFQLQGCNSFRRYNTHIDVPPYSVVIHPSTMKEMVVNFNTDNVYITEVFKASNNEVQNQSSRTSPKCESVVARISYSDDILPGEAAIPAIFQLQLDVEPLRNFIRLRILNQQQVISAQNVPCYARCFNICPVVIDQQKRPNSKVEEDLLEYSKFSSINYGDDSSFSIRQLELDNKGKVLTAIKNSVRVLSSQRTPLSFPALIPYVSEHVKGNNHLWCISLSPVRDNNDDQKFKHIPAFLFVREFLQYLNEELYFEVAQTPAKVIEEFSYFRLVPKYLSTLGIRDQLGFCIHYLHHYMTFSNSLPDIPGIVVSGEEGVGKTHFLLTIALVARLLLGYSTICVDCKRFKSTSMPLKDVLDSISRIFLDAYYRRPTVVLLDNLDTLIPEVDNEEGMDISNKSLIDQSKLITDHIISLYSEIMLTHEINENGPAVVLICSVKHYSRLNKSLRIPYRLDLGVELGLPDSKLRKELFIFMTKLYTANDDLDKILGAMDFSNKTEGFRQVDMHSLAVRCMNIARLKSLGRISNSSNVKPLTVAFTLSSFMKISQTDIELALSSFTPMSVRNSGSMKGKTLWEDIGGLKEAKQELIDCVIKPIIFKQIYRRAPIRLPRGILLFGPSGCGKTALASALANKAGLNMITCKGPEILDRYIGASEAAVRNLFQRAYSVSPALLFFDEFEALAPKRGSDNTGVTDRVVNQLLTFMDGVETGKGTLYILAATTRPDMIDPALLRPGRLDKHVYIGPPNTTDEVKEILRVFCEGRPLSRKAQELTVNNSFIDKMRDLKRLSAVDLKTVIDDAYLKAIHDHISRNKESKEIEISDKNLKESFYSCRQSISDWDAEFYDRIYHSFMKVPSGSLSLQANDTKEAADLSEEGFETNTMNNSTIAHQQRTTLR